MIAVAHDVAWLPQIGRETPVSRYGIMLGNEFAFRVDGMYENGVAANRLRLGPPDKCNVASLPIRLKQAHLAVPEYGEGTRLGRVDGASHAERTNAQGRAKRAPVLGNQQRLSREGVVKANVEPVTAQRCIGQDIQCNRRIHELLRAPRLVDVPQV